MSLPLQHPLTSMCLAIAALTLSGELVAAPDNSRPEQRSTQQDQTQVSLTIYNDNLALIKDRRTLRLPTGPLSLAFSDISAQIKPETAQLRAAGAGPALVVEEQNFDFDLLTPSSLLSKYVGRDVEVIRTHPTTGADIRESARVLAVNNGVVLQYADRIETGVPGRLAFAQVPDTLRARPTLVMALQNQTVQPQDVELSYLSTGLSWKSDYVLELRDDSLQADLTGWVTLTNTSGSSYRQARLQLVAGDVHQAPTEPAPRVLHAPLPMAMAAKTAPMREESLLEYHLYTLDHPTTLADNQTKQVNLLGASAVQTRKELVLQGSPYYYQTASGDLGKQLKVSAFLEFDNRTANHLGIPMPKGVVRVYQRDQAGRSQFVGEDRIDHTARDAVVRLKLGESFDITADKSQTDFKYLGDNTKAPRTTESAYTIELHNGGDTAATVTVMEPMPGEWKIVTESLPHSTTSSLGARWSVPVPARGNARLTYRVVTRL